MFSGAAAAVLTVVSVILLETVHGELGTSCITPNGESATCKSIFDCQILLDAVNSRNSEKRTFSRKSQCGFRGHPLVCCGTQDVFTTKKSPLPDRTSCGFQETDRIIGGTETSLKEFPWMAMLIGRNISGDILTFLCGGTVISKRYILTAAHCVKGDVLLEIGPPYIARLGASDVTKLRQCETIAGILLCNDPPEDFEIEEVVAHPDYDTTRHYNDIALLRLNRKITYTDYIRPICLPLPREASEVGDRLFTAGWGATETGALSSVKLKVEVPFAEKSDCNLKFKSTGLALRNSQICAGGEAGKDSCPGDSGGPLLRTTKNDTAQWYVEGIVSLGIECGTEGWPSVYTKVSNYLEWIQKTVRN